MKQVLYVEWLISLPHATNMMKKLGKKKHAGLGYYFDLVDLGTTIEKAARVFPAEQYSHYDSSDRLHPAYHLKVYRDI